MIPALDEVKAQLEAADASLVGKITVEAPALIIARDGLTAAARWLKTGPLKLDYLANLCATDWLPKAPGFFEVVYHLYSVQLRHGPLVVKCRTPDRVDTHMPSVTPVWRGAEYQEREAYDLYGVHFDGHPDLRRILTWDELTDFPMRKDYKPPDDYEWEPTPHGDVVERVRERMKREGEA